MIRRLLACWSLAVLLAACHAVPFEAETGSLDVAYEGLPAPWTTGGVGMLVSSEAPDLAVSASGTLTEVPVGAYTFEADPLALCGTTYAPDPPSQPITIDGGATKVVSVAYTPVAVATAGFRARVTGVHSVLTISAPAELEGTLVPFEDGVRVFACARSIVDLDLFPDDVEPDDGIGTHVVVSEASIRVGLGVGADLVADLEIVPASCVLGFDPTSDAPIRTCKTFIAGDVVLTPALMDALGNGALALQATVPWAADGRLAASIDPVAP